MTPRSMHAIAALLLLQMLGTVIAPSQMLDALCDLWNPQVHRSVTPSPESTTTPTITEIAAETSGGSLIAPVASWGASAPSTSAPRSMSITVVSAWLLFSTPQVQRSILRV